MTTTAWAPSHRSSDTPGAPTIPVLRDGHGWLVVAKPAGVASTPNARRPGPDVVTLLGMAPAHRFDRGTSGCVLLTRAPATARALDLAFRARLVARQYLAVVESAPRRDRFTIDAAIGPDANSRVPGKVTELATGDAAVSAVEVLERWHERALVRAICCTRTAWRSPIRPTVHASRSRRRCRPTWRTRPGTTDARPWARR